MNGKRERGSREQGSQGHDRRPAEKARGQRDRESRRFNEALKFVLRWEGGVSHDPADRGGLTKQGVTQKTYDRYRTREGKPPQSVRSMTAKEVREIYRRDYWDRSGAGSLSPKLGLVHFDTAVNMGPRRASQFLKTVNGLPHRQAVTEYLEKRDAFYRRLAERKPSQRKFLKGWLRRTAALRGEVSVERPVSRPRIRKRSAPRMAERGR